MIIWDFVYTGLGGCKRDALPTELIAPGREGASLAQMPRGSSLQLLALRRLAPNQRSIDSVVSCASEMKTRRPSCGSAWRCTNPLSVSVRIQRRAVVAGTPAAIQSEVTLTRRRSDRAAARSSRISQAGSANKPASKYCARNCRAFISLRIMEESGNWTRSARFREPE